MNDQNKDLKPTEIVEIVRERARKILRTLNINSIEEILVGLRVELKALPEKLEDATKKVEIAEYRLSQVDDSDPQADERKKNRTKTVEQAQEEVKRVEKFVVERTETLEKDITNKNEAVEKWESGEKKVNMNEITETAAKIIKREG